MDKRDLFTVSEIARRSGFAASAIRFYESQGLITATRTSGNQRRFERQMLRRLAFIKAARAGVESETLRPWIDNYMKWIFTGQLRLADGTPARNRPLPHSLWPISSGLAILGW